MKNMKLKKRLKPDSQAAYQNHNLKAFSSHEYANEAVAKEMAALSPTEHLQNVNALIRKLFADELSRPMNKKIRFDRVLTKSGISLSQDLANIEELRRINKYRDQS